MKFDLHQNQWESPTHNNQPTPKYEIKIILLEMQCLHDFHSLNFADLKQLLTSSKDSRDHLLHITNPHTKYDISQGHAS